MLRFALPMFLGTLLQQVYNLCDTMIVGRALGDGAVAAIGATTALYSVMIYFANGMSNGCGIIIAQVFGAAQNSRGDEKMKKAVASMVALNAAVAIVLTAVSLLLLSALLRLLGTPQEIFHGAHSYIFIVMAGMCATVAYNAAAGFMRSVGNSKTPLVALAVSCALNIALDLLFVIPLKMGVAGAALATVLAQAVSAFLCVIYIKRNYKNFLPSKRGWKLERDMAREMFFTGLSMGLMLSVFSLGSIILQKGINSLGSKIIAAHTVSRRIYEFLMMPMGTLASAASTFVGQNFGAAKTQRIKTAIRQSIAVVALWSIFCVAVGFSAGGALSHLLIGTSDEVVIKNSVLNLRVCVLFFFPLGALLVLRNALQSLGHKVAPVVSSAVELLLKIVFCAVAVPRAGYLGVVVTEPVIWVVCAIFLTAVYLKSENNVRR